MQNVFATSLWTSQNDIEHTPIFHVKGVSISFQLYFDDFNYILEKSVRNYPKVSEKWSLINSEFLTFGTFSTKKLWRISEILVMKDRAEINQNIPVLKWQFDEHFTSFHRTMSLVVPENSFRYAYTFTAGSVLVWYEELRRQLGAHFDILQRCCDRRKIWTVCGGYY